MNREFLIWIALVIGQIIGIITVFIIRGDDKWVLKVQEN